MIQQTAVASDQQAISAAGALLNDKDSKVIAETFNAEQTWRLLWSRAVSQVIAALPPACYYECVPVGCGWGLRGLANPRRTLVIHPSSNAREIGDLALTIRGVGTQVIPRRRSSYVEYLHTVADTIEATLKSSPSN